ncbi:serine acetyltransferase [Deltaproteobacteria bacterium Smac51]|nr:serine acetyltransferase [Deltaproteobacteria bacterium Smac51]
MPRPDYVHSERVIMPPKSPSCRQIINFDRNKEISEELAGTVKKLLRQRRKLSSFEHVSQVPKPSFREAKELIKLTQQLAFPGFFSPQPVTEVNVSYHIGQVLDAFYDLLSREAATSIRHDCRRYNYDCSDCVERGRLIAMEVVQELPALREILASDVAATLEGDPAAGDHYDQIIFCYPGLFATMVQRLAHRLYLRDVPFLPRILTEYAHSKTGIDIHPGAHIGPKFFIDHGTGVVIGETTAIGSCVRIYQGVTLGALSLPRDAGTRLQGKKRHPTLEDGVIVYAGATILGGDTVIGAGSVVGGNVWLTESIPPGTKVLIKNPELIVINGQTPENKKAAGTRAAKTKKNAPPKAKVAKTVEKAEKAPRRGRPAAAKAANKPGRPAAAKAVVKKRGQ